MHTHVQQQALMNLIPVARDLLPEPLLYSDPVVFISNSKAFANENYTQKCQELAHSYKNPGKQPIESLKQLFSRCVYQRFVDLRIFRNENMDFNFIKYPLQNQNKRVENTESTVRDFSNNIQFDSEFESGNLSKVHRLLNNQYNLLLQNDINTFGYNQWFFFKVSVKSKIKVKFNIVNMYKRKSLYQKGMKIAVLSINKSKKVGWERGGQEINYFANNYQLSGKKLYTLTWTYTFQQNEQVYFAYNFPYTCSDLNIYLDRITSLELPYFKRDTLCKTISGNRIDFLTITETQNLEAKKFIIISARVHSGETVSSFMMKGIIDYLLTPEAADLRRRFIFRLVPMINPDGVINGNYRCSLSGKDLNRRWKQPSRLKYPEIYYLKKMIVKIAKEKRLEMFCDLHGHSAKKSIFFYGCAHLENPYKGREFPFLLSKISQNFNYLSCCFRTQQNKKGTARVSLYQKTKNPYIYTIESSFCGREKSEVHYTVGDYEQEGKKLCEAIGLYFKNTIDKSKEQQHTQIIKQLYENKHLFTVGENNSSASDSNPSVDQVQQQFILSKNYKAPIGYSSRKSSLPHLTNKRPTQNKQQLLPIIKTKLKSSSRSPENELIRRKTHSQLALKRNLIKSRIPSVSKHGQITEARKVERQVEMSMVTIDNQQKIGSESTKHTLNIHKINQIIAMRQKGQIVQHLTKQFMQSLLKNEKRQPRLNAATVTRIGLIEKPQKQLVNKPPFTINLIFQGRNISRKSLQRK